MAERHSALPLGGRELTGTADMSREETTFLGKDTDLRCYDTRVFLAQRRECIP